MVASKTIKPLLGRLIESPMKEISDEEVDYGSFESSVNPSTEQFMMECKPRMSKSRFQFSQLWNTTTRDGTKF